MRKSWKIILLIIEQLHLPCQLILIDYTAHHWAVAASMATYLIFIVVSALPLPHSCGIILLRKQYETNLSRLRCHCYLDESRRLVGWLAASHQTILGGWNKSRGDKLFLGMTMKEMASHLREGWYGNERDIPNGNSHWKCPVDCNKTALFVKFEICRNKVHTTVWGDLGNDRWLVVDGTHEDGPVGPVETFVIHLTKEEGPGDEWEAM
jgi:hypothetical protein